MPCNAYDSACIRSTLPTIESFNASNSIIFTNSTQTLSLLKVHLHAIPIITAAKKCITKWSGIPSEVWPAHLTLDPTSLTDSKTTKLKLDYYVNKIKNNKKQKKKQTNKSTSTIYIYWHWTDLNDPKLFIFGINYTRYWNEFRN